MKTQAQKIVDKMYENDAFSQWLGIELMEIRTSYAKIKMTTRAEMVNGFGIVHGGISFSFADSAFAFACNSPGRHAVSIDTSISHLKKIGVGETIFAEAKEENLSHKTGLYRIEVTNEKGELLALFKGTNYRSSREWEV